MAPAKVLLQRDQFLRAAEPDFALGLARRIVRGKVSNSRAFLLRWARKIPSQELRRAALSLKNLLRRIDEARSLDEVRGLEGAAASSYFRAWPEILGETWPFAGRKRRPPPDPVNSLLSYGYTHLYQNAYSLLRAQGLHPYVGFCHGLRQGHAALASDLIEEFRAPVVDAAVIALLRRRQLSPDDFTLPSQPGQPCWLSPQARRKATRAFESALNRLFRHPDGPSRCDYRRAMAMQCRRLALAIQGVGDYQPFLIR